MFIENNALNKKNIKGVQLQIEMFNDNASKWNDLYDKIQNPFLNL